MRREHLANIALAQSHFFSDHPWRHIGIRKSIVDKLAQPVEHLVRLLPDRSGFAVSLISVSGPKHIDEPLLKAAGFESADTWRRCNAGGQHILDDKPQPPGQSSMSFQDNVHVPVSGFLPISGQF